MVLSGLLVWLWFNALDIVFGEFWLAFVWMCVCLCCFRLIACGWFAVVELWFMVALLLRLFA